MWLPRRQGLKMTPHYKVRLVLRRIKVPKGEMIFREEFPWKNHTQTDILEHMIGTIRKPGEMYKLIRMTIKEKGLGSTT